jgi:hypothetical protein
MPLTEAHVSSRGGRHEDDESLNRPSPTHVERARRLLAYEGAAGSVDDRASTAAGRVYDKLNDHMAPLVGDEGVKMLLVRSAKLTRGEFAHLADVAIFERSAKLRECLHARDPGVAAESAEALFGTFLALITAFIGERLTTQVLRSAWPTLEETAPRETEQ